MPLSSDLNANYNPASANVTEKYTPLQGINVAGGDAAAVGNIITNRMTSFTNVNIVVNQLTFLATSTINDFAAAEAGRGAPLVVVSTNRAGWIRAGYDNANNLGGGVNFTSVNDVNALALGPVPMYIPLRMSAAEAAVRSVYIFVAAEEYGQYSRELSGTGITVIGWRSVGDMRLSGFGASRYVALEFFKYINARNGACANIWMLDDNVVYIRSFPGLAAVEGQLAPYYGISFHGCTQVSTNQSFVTMAHNAVPAPVLATAHIAAPILQQAVLWNVTRFVATNRSFSPYFMTSAEDTSLTKFLGPANCRYYGGCAVLKGNPAFDNTVGATTYQRLRDELQAYVYAQRNAAPFTSPAVAGSATLFDVINATRNAATSPPMIAATAQEGAPQTYSKAVEQILSQALQNNVALPAGVFVMAQTVITSKLTPTF